MTSHAKLLFAGVALATSFIAASPASAMLIVNPVTGGTGIAGAFQGNDIGTISGLHVKTSNTYEFTFTIAPGAVLVLSQLQASIPNAHQKVQFSLYSGAPSLNPPPANLIDTSTVDFGPQLTDVLGMGSYFLKLDYIAKNNELVSGSLDVRAIVPEPATWGLMLVGVAGLGVALRRKRVATAAA